MISKSTICHLIKHIVQILVDYQNYLKSQTGLKFRLKNILSLWSWALVSDGSNPPNSSL